MSGCKQGRVQQAGDMQLDGQMDTFPGAAARASRFRAPSAQARDN